VRGDSKLIALRLGSGLGRKEQVGDDSTGGQVTDGEQAKIHGIHF
jgi:hypothetical protein